jgi:hypothetical protein
MRPTAILAAIAAAACAAAIAPAGIASAEESPQEVLNRLQNEGYQVNVDRVGSAPINQCVVTNVRNPQTVTELVRVYDGRDKNGDIDWDFIEVVTSRSISVSLNCTR